MSKQLELRVPYRHFKGKLYYVHYLAKHTETEQQLVIYQTLYPPFEVYARPLEDFLEKVDLKRKDNITKQEYRFEPYKGLNE